LLLQPEATAGDRLLLAETLAWSKEFAEAEQLYRLALQAEPGRREAGLGLARVVLWQARYREARALFSSMLQRDRLDIDALEGRATAAYWSGDFRSAGKEFRTVLERDPGREFAAKSLREIESSARPVDRIVADFLRDDQPFENRRAEASTSLFSDPLTRWDVNAGSYSLYASVDETTRSAPYILIGNTTVLPWQRLTVTSSIGAMRFPDGAMLPIGSLSLRRRLGAHGSIELAARQRELLSNIADRYRYARHYALRWERQLENSWLAAVHLGRVTYADGNAGSQADAYYLRPIGRNAPVHFSGGVSAAWRDTRESRFLPDVIQSIRDSDDPTMFRYSYQGRYIPYWTPERLRELRGIVAAEIRPGRVTTRLQIDAGRARDRGVAFFPSSGTAPLPGAITPLSFSRSYNPWRVRLTTSIPFLSGYSIEAAYEHSDTIHYKANSLHASVARRR
jgi:hypothetical protein